MSWRLESHSFQKTTRLAFSPLRTVPPSSLACRKVSQKGEANPVQPSRKGLIPRYGRRLIRFCGWTHSDIEDMRHVWLLIGIAIGAGWAGNREALGVHCPEIDRAREPEG